MTSETGARDDLTAMAKRLGACLQAAGWRMATAESCTGGWIAKSVTDLTGSSGWFECGFVTYSNEAKQEMLGVAGASLAANGAVSEAVALEMARGAAARSHADVAVAVSGIAGPGGGTAAKPVGTVCFGYLVPGCAEAETHLFQGGREAVRRASVEQALRGLIARCGGV